VEEVGVDRAGEYHSGYWPVELVQSGDIWWICLIESVDLVG
jgi:hypothetical protein